MSKAMTAASKEQLMELMQYLSQNISVPTIGIGGGFAPIGTIISYMGTTAPQDYLICDGTTYNIADYKQLSDFFAAQFGSANFFGGDGVTTFKVPDLRGEFLRGTGTNSHTDQGSGANVGVHQDGTEIPKIFVNGENNMIGTPNTPTSFLGMTKVDSDLRKNVSGKGKQAELSNEWDSTSYNVATVRPTNTSVLYCIKAVAAGDVYSTTERVVGTWIDGKKVYEKTIDCGSLPNSNTSAVSTGISVDINVISITGFAKRSSDGMAMPLPRAYPESKTDQTLKYSIEIDYTGNTNKTIRIITGHDYSAFDAYITIRYTKTTD